MKINPLPTPRRIISVFDPPCGYCRGRLPYSHDITFHPFCTCGREPERTRPLEPGECCRGGEVTHSQCATCVMGFQQLKGLP